MHIFESRMLLDPWKSVAFVMQIKIQRQRIGQPGCSSEAYSAVCGARFVLDQQLIMGPQVSYASGLEEDASLSSQPPWLPVVFSSQTAYSH